MTGQEKLEYIGVLKEKYLEQEYFVKELRSILDGVTGISYDKDPVQTSKTGDSILNRLCRIEEEEQKLQRMKEEWKKWKVEMIQRIHMMNVGNLQRMLYVMYIEEHTLKETAGIMCWSYDHAKKQYKKAIQEFEKINPLITP